MSKNPYENLRLDVIQKLVDERSITCKNNKTDMIKHLLMDDSGKYVRETTYQKYNDGFIIGIDIKNQDHLVQMGNFVLKKDSHCMGRYIMGLTYYWGKQKLI